MATRRGRRTGREKIKLWFALTLKDSEVEIDEERCAECGKPVNCEC